METSKKVINWERVNELTDNIITKIFGIFKFKRVLRMSEENRIHTLAYYLFRDQIDELYISEDDDINEKVEEMKNIFFTNFASGQINNGVILEVTAKLLRLLSIYIISKYQHWMNTVSSDETKFFQYNSDERVISILKDLYHQHDLNEDIMQFIILNTQIALAKKQSVFNENVKNKIGIGIDKRLAVSGVDLKSVKDEGKVNFIDGFNLVDCMSKTRIYSKLASINKGSRKISSEDKEELLNNLDILLSAMMFFKDISISKNKNNLINLEDDFFLYETHGIMRESSAENNYELLYLGEIRYNKENNRLILIYHTLDNEQKITYQVREHKDNTEDDEMKISGEIIYVDSVENYYLAITGHVLESRNTANGLAGLISYNYKYINKLALAIVDSIENQEYDRCHRNLVNLMRENIEVFEEELTIGKMNDGTDGNEKYELLNWDIALIKLLTYESPSRVLKVLFKEATSNDIKVINNIIVNLKLRLPNNFDIKRTFDIRDQIKNRIMSQLPIFNEGKSLVDPKYRHEWEDKITVDATINALVSVLSQNFDDESAKKYQNDDIYSNSIYDKISIVNNLNPRNEEEKKIAKHLCDEMLCDAIKKYLCFYSGISECATERLKYENETFNCCLSDEELDNFQQDIEDKILEGVYVKALELSSLSTPTQFLWEIKKLHDACYEDNNIDDLTQFGKSIKVILGHLPINFKRFTDLVYYGKNGEVGFKVVNNYTSYTLLLDNDELENITDYTKSVEKILLFLAGNIENRSSVRAMERFKRMIYPATATFSGNRVNREKMTLLQFTLILDDKIAEVTSNYDNNISMHRMNEVSISTEFSYQINEQFYCLPNVLRITDYLWADPILIPCDKFNKAIKRAKEDSE